MTMIVLRQIWVWIIVLFFVTGGTNSFRAAQPIESSSNSSAVSMSNGGKCAHFAAPAIPTNLQAGTITSNSASFSWGASTTSAVSQYLISRNGAQIASIAGSTLSFLDVTVLPATTYTYGVQAQNSCGKISQAATLTVTTPSLPPPTATLAANPAT